MCCAEFIVKYVLFFANLLFCLASLALMGLGIAVLVQLSDLEVLQASAVRAIPIAIIVLGALIFLIAFFGCCGAIRESRCFLMTYVVIMMLLAAGKIYLTVVLFRGLSHIQSLVEEWIGSAFNKPSMRDAFHVMEAAFRCCGTTGPESYTGILEQLPWSCCAEPHPDLTCDRIGAYSGCNDRLGGYFDSFGGAIGAVLITLIVVEVVAIIFGFFLCHSVGNKRRVRNA